MKTRPRRLRESPLVRALVAETRLSPARLVVPHFVVPGRGREEAVPSMPGVVRESADLVAERVKRDIGLGLTSHLFFGVAEEKDAVGAAAADPKGPVPSALRAVRSAVGGDALLAADVCLCAYTTHGHCGIPDARGRIDNDASLPPLAAAAVAYAQAGADLVAPSDMMDGRVAAIRDALDAGGLHSTGILSYAAKYASAYYGPFRDAAHSAPSFGDRRTYQMDPRNVREAVREALLDEEEGADMVMVKPGLPCLDVIRAVREAVRVPVAAYNVSGEYTMVKLAAQAGVLDEAAVVRENLTALTRAGADVIVTYHARDALEKGWL
ncbi:MAG TPA: porphobilinogen synthase [Candidatus Thermoplasmatota archaeon]|nr:porphobilinogen synthase [Candidatus Thermoplasmatota archaeon]